MTTMPFCEGAHELFALAEEIADVLAQKRLELGPSDKTEALLRASIAAAMYARTVYTTLRQTKVKSALARRFLKQAEHRWKRALDRLREHVIRTLVVICESMNHGALVDVGEHVLSVSA